ncbi:MAG: PD-(D/E)XK nuclease family protein [Planctomycetota bacterium]
MAVRLIAGRAGSGKTHWCQARIRDALAASPVDGPRLVMLVPEQAALQMERGLLSMSPTSALGRCDVLSFRRLAHRILNDTPGAMPTVLTPIGRQMALRHLITRHRKSLREFGKMADRGGAITAIARTIGELLQEAVSPEQLEETARSTTDRQDPCATRLGDLALLYRAYLEYLGSERVDPEGVLDLARTRLCDTPWARDAHIWIDGFAGLTQQQVRMIAALAGLAPHVDIGLLLDPTRGRARDPDAPPDDLSLFARTERTWFTLLQALHEAGIPIDEPVLLDNAPPPRFGGAEPLALLEKHLFTGPVSPHESEARSVRPPRRTTIRAPSASERVHIRAARVSERSLCDRAAIVRLVRAPDQRTEVEAAVAAIVDLVQRPESPMRYRDIAIIVRNLEPYHEIISATLAAHGIPFFIDRRRPTYHHPLIHLVRAAMAMHGSGPFDQAVAMLLKTGLSGLDDNTADALENYVLACGLVSAAAWQEPWTHPASSEGSDTPASRDAVRQAEAARQTLVQQVGDWWPKPGAQRGRPACRTWVKRLYALLERLRAIDRLSAWCDEAEARGDLDEAAEHEHVWTDLVRLLDQLVETLGDELMTGRQFREVLESGLSEFTLGLVPATLDQVLVGSIERSRHPAVRAAFVLGFGDGQFPARMSEDAILGDEERLRLEQSGISLGRTLARRLLDERMLAYIALTRPSEHLWISFPMSDESGRPLAPTPYWNAVRTVLPDVPVETVSAESPTSISTASRLAGSLASQMRSWCEHAGEAGNAEEPRTSVRAVTDDAAANVLRRHPAREPTGETPVPPVAPPAAQILSISGAGAWPALYDWARITDSVATKVAAALSALAPPHKARLSATAAASLWPPPHRTSVTRLERFAQCPFQHFSAHGLALRERPIHQIGALDLGRLYHTVLEQFVNELIETDSHLGDMSAGDIARSLSRLCRDVVPQYAQDVRMEPHEQRAAVWRGDHELPPAITGEKAAVGKTRLRPVATEQAFGDMPGDALPALELKLARGRFVAVRGVIDRVDVLQTGDAALTVVFDYKRGIGRRLQLEEVYHGLALQLLAYLLVIRDHGKHLVGGEVVPGGAFYLPLLGEFKRVEHPDEAEQEDFDAFKTFRPRGVIDFDWIDRIEPTFDTGWSDAFAVYRTKDGRIGHAENNDAVESGVMPRLIEHVRAKMTELAEDWLSGNIAVMPARLGKQTPCSWCAYRTVCRIEYATRESRVLRKMKRSDVLAELADEKPADCDPSGCQKESQ